MPVPYTGKPTLRLAVLATGTVIEFELLVVVAAMVETAGKPVPVTISPKVRPAVPPVAFTVTKLPADWLMAVSTMLAA